MDELFHVGERKSTIGTELRAGLTTFLAMAYIIAVNPAVALGRRHRCGSARLRHLPGRRHHDHLHGASSPTARSPARRA